MGPWATAGIRQQAREFVALGMAIHSVKERILGTKMAV